PNGFGEFTFGLSVNGEDACGTIQLTLHIEQQAPYILQVYPPFPLPVDVKLGTRFEDIVLPASVEVLLSDQSKVSLPVTWTAGDYNGDVVGNYIFNGILSLTDSQMNPDSLQGHIRVSVFDPVTKYIIAVDSVPPVYVRSGTLFS